MILSMPLGCDVLVYDILFSVGDDDGVADDGGCDVCMIRMKTS